MATGKNEVQEFQDLFSALIRIPGDSKIAARFDDELSKARYRIGFDGGIMRGWPQKDGLRGYLLNKANELGGIWWAFKSPDKKGDRTWYPYVSLDIKSCASNDANPILGIHVLSLAAPNDDPEATDLVSLGMRFEAPYGGEFAPVTGGRHDYYHFQFSPTSRSPDGPAPFCPPWLPDSEPAVPLLRPSDGLEFLFVVLLALYGYQEAANFVRHADSENATRKFLGLLT